MVRRNSPLQEKGEGGNLNANAPFLPSPFCQASSSFQSRVVLYSRGGKSIYVCCCLHEQSPLPPFLGQGFASSGPLHACRATGTERRGEKILLQVPRKRKKQKRKSFLLFLPVQFLHSSRGERPTEGSKGEHVGSGWAVTRLTRTIIGGL